MLAQTGERISEQEKTSKKRKKEKEGKTPYHRGITQITRGILAKARFETTDQHRRRLLQKAHKGDHGGSQRIAA